MKVGVTYFKSLFKSQTNSQNTDTYFMRDTSWLAVMVFSLMLLLSVRSAFLGPVFEPAQNKVSPCFCTQYCTPCC